MRSKVAKAIRKSAQRLAASQGLPLFTAYDDKINKHQRLKIVDGKPVLKEDGSYEMEEFGILHRTLANCARRINQKMKANYYKNQAAGMHA